MTNQKSGQGTRGRRGPNQRTYTSHSKTYTLKQWSVIRGRELDTESIRQRIKNETAYNDVYMRGRVPDR